VHTATNKVRSQGSHGLAITQVDVVGHSMGGLIARARTAAKNGLPRIYVPRMPDKAIFISSLR